MGKRPSEESKRGLWVRLHREFSVTVCEHGVNINTCSAHTTLYKNRESWGPLNVCPFNFLCSPSGAVSSTRNRGGGNRRGCCYGTIPLADATAARSSAVASPAARQLEWRLLRQQQQQHSTLQCSISSTVAPAREAKRAVGPGGRPGYHRADDGGGGGVNDGGMRFAHSTAKPHVSSTACVSLSYITCGSTMVMVVR